MTLLAVDPGTEKNWGACWFRGGQFDDFMRFYPEYLAWFDERREDCWVEFDDVPVLAIETQFSKVFTDKHGTKHHNIKALLSLHKAAMRWVIPAELAGWQVIEVAPSTWQSKMLGRASSQHSPSLARAVWSVAQEITGGLPMTPDQASAVCIGQFVLDKMKLETTNVS